MEFEHVALNDPRRPAIVAEIQGKTIPLPSDRLQSVAQPTVIDGHRFPSKKEAKRYTELKVSERAGIIVGLQLQVTIPIVVNGCPIFAQGYRADFTYLEIRSDKKSCDLVIEDCKGVRTDVYMIKAKLIKAIYGITIRET